jgi:hypothetical protein
MERSKTVVVVVDDDWRVLKSLGEFLDSAGYDARLFLSLEKCLASVEIKAAGCFITGQVNAVGIKAPCILLAERNEIDTMAFCSTGDARFLFSKPIVGPELLAAVALITGCPAVVQRIGFAEIVACVTGLMKRISLLTLIGRLLGVGARRRSRLWGPRTAIRLATGNHRFGGTDAATVYTFPSSCRTVRRRKT